MKAAILLCAVASLSRGSAQASPGLDAILAVGSEERGTAADADARPKLTAAANWLRGAVPAIASRPAVKLRVDAIKALAMETKNRRRSRELAFDLLRQADEELRPLPLQ